jgi:hypothetical protein
VDTSPSASTTRPSPLGSKARNRRPAVVIEPYPAMVIAEAVVP